MCGICGCNPCSCQSISGGPWVASTVAQFKTQFFRDFPYGTDPKLAVLDQDITNAFNQVDISINMGFFGTQTAFTIAYNLLAAHYMTLALRASTQGINGQFNWAQNSKGVGAVNEAFTIPQRIIDDPYLMMLTKTNYGMQYLQMILPLLAGQMFTVAGYTRA